MGNQLNYVVRVCAAVVDDVLPFDLSEETFGLRNGSPPNPDSCHTHSRIVSEEAQNMVKVVQTLMLYFRVVAFSFRFRLRVN